MDWTEAHRPRSLADVVGNGPALSKLRKWAEGWQEGVPDKRAVVLSGPPGVGKTSAALALARDMGWAAIELNASDARNAEAIRRVATAGALHQTFNDDGSFHATGTDGGRKLIILDEADNLYERMDSESGGAGSDLSDRGGKAQIVDTVRRTRQPIVLIVNDLYGLLKGSGAALRQLAETIKFSRVHTRSIPKALAQVARAEEVRVEAGVLEAIAARSEGDLRAAVRDLESLCTGRDEVTARDLHSLGARDVTGNVFDMVRHVLKGRPLDQLRRESMDLDATPEDLVLWLDENIPKEYKDPGDLERAYAALARADVFLGRTRRTQNYRLWAYAGDLSVGGVMTARRREYRGFTPFSFPQWLGRMSRTRAVRRARDGLTDRLAREVHCSRRKARLFQLDVHRALFAADAEFAAHQTHRLELTDDEVALLLSAKAGSRDVKAVREAADALAAKEATAVDEEDGPGGETAGEKPEAREDPRPSPSQGQASLFGF